MEDPSVSLIEYIVESLVDQPEDVELTQIPGDEENIIELRVHDDDVGKVIGKNGSVARALRTLLTAVSTKDQKNYSLEIID